jgi:hypothetical protein
MARARASLAISEPEFDEAWPEDIATARRAAPRLVVAPGEPAAADVRGGYGEPTAADVRGGYREPTVGVPRGTAVPGRRTVTIRGQVAPRPESRRPRRDPYDRVGSRPDRIAMWAVLLCVLLVLVAATSSHAAVMHLALHARP